MARRLAAAMNAPVVELDALNWLPDWVSLAETDPQAFEARVVEATAGEAWVLAGSYMNFTRRLCWGRLQSVVWLDLSLSLILRRVVSRSWRRWRSRELLWGTNRESFLTHLKVWSKDSLLCWALTTHKQKRRSLLAAMVDPQWAHIRFIRLTSVAEVDEFTRLIEQVARVPEPPDTQG
ncbi:MAG TPA: hypothetical protein EYQ31_07690 [Candidatus Handelsmanbacteria bacterium]|nr:hypothetical protein [Candidatus Handelsmanbacteria bacterium]